MKKVLLLLAIILPIFLPTISYAQGFGSCSAGNPCRPGLTCNPATGQCMAGASGGGGASTASCTPTGGGTGVNTALGCIPTDPEGLVKWILGWSVAMGGGIAILLSLWGGVQIILAGGNPEKINEGKEIITSAISGLLFIVFSVFLLRFIGFNVLGIFN